MNNIFCVIPAYNEEKNIKKAIESVKAYIENIIVVDDGSSDKTVEIVKASGAHILRHVVNRGQGAALQTGNELALKLGADIILHYDADNQFDAHDINKLINPLINQKADVVFGSRFLEKKSKIPWTKEYIIFPIARLVNLVFFGIKFKDPQSGYRALSRKAAQIINIEQSGMAHCSEIMAKAHKNNLKIKEVPITVKYHKYGQNINGGIRIIKDLIFAKLIN